MTITSWDRESLDDLPLTWFQSRITVEQIRACFAFAQKEIRIACGFFTVRGWGLIRRHTKNKRVYLLVGIEEPGREQARQALVADILRNLTSGRDRERRTSVEELVTRMASREVYVVDARATDHHGKLYLVDCNAAITTSANTTGRGFLNQIESGTILAPVVVERFLREHARTFAPEVAQAIALQMEQFIRNQVGAYVRQFDEYFAQAEDITAQLLQELHDWLELARPWDIYLKTILAFEQLQPVNCYGKQPVSYQQDMIAQALRQIREHGGSMLVASTGLGKTIKATHIGLQLHAQDEIDSVIIVCPKAVVSSWKNEMRDAGLHADFFTLSTLDRQSPTDARGLEDWEQIVERVRSGEDTTCLYSTRATSFAIAIQRNISIAAITKKQGANA